jgi:hypothetical protein
LEWQKGAIKLSSLFSKLKTLVQSGARGPRRRKKAPDGAREPGSIAEVTKSTARQRNLAEVTEAPPAYVARPQAAVSKPAPVVAEPKPDEEQAGALEEERVADLLKGKQA